MEQVEKEGMKLYDKLSCHLSLFKVETMGVDMKVFYCQIIQPRVVESLCLHLPPSITVHVFVVLHYIFLEVDIIMDGIILGVE